MKVSYTDLNKEDHAHIHDTMYRALGYISSEEYIEEVFDSMPERLKFMAAEWGCNDTVFRDEFYKWLKLKS